MRFLMGFLAVALVASAVAQTSAAPPPLAIHPDLVVFLRRNAGADVLEISMVDADYPAALLTKQVNDLCARLKVPAIGLQVYTDQMVAGNPKLQFIHATFATSGITHDDGTINLTPLIQAFAGAPAPHTISGMNVIVDDFTPTPKTIKDFPGPGAVVQGRIDSNPPDVEYQIKLLSQNPSDINVQVGAPIVERKPSRPPESGTNTILVWSLTILAGLGASALVYFLVVNRLTRGSGTAAVRKP
jgi:hypothetical protein